LLLSEGLDTQTFDFYLKVAKAYRRMDDKRKNHYGRGVNKDQ
jgi:hypothetical protein